MPSGNKKLLTVVISSTILDLPGHRRQVEEACLAQGMFPKMMEHLPAADIDAVGASLKLVDEADVYLGVFAFRYGHVPSGFDISITEMEYTRATERGIPCLIFLMDKDHPITIGDVETGDGSAKLAAFKRRLSADHALRFFRSPEDLRAHVINSLSQCGAESRAIAELLHLTLEDFNARRTGTVNHEWFVPAVARCSVFEDYIPREDVLGSVAKWRLTDESHYLFLVGPSGIGKTNFLVELIRNIAAPTETQRLAQQAAMYVSLGSCSVKPTFQETLQKSLESHPRLAGRLEAGAIVDSIKSGTVLLILDGLDELARNQDEGQCHRLLESLKELGAGSAKVIISCRDHIYRRLTGKGILSDREGYRDYHIPFLDSPAVWRTLERRLGKGSHPWRIVAENKALLDLAKNPLLLEMICSFRDESWASLTAARTLGKLYDAWFKAIITRGTGPHDLDETLTTLGHIAGLMLKRRSDLVSDRDLKRLGLPLDRIHSLTRAPFGILIQETYREWGFVHSSFREFALAKAVQRELFARRYDLLSSISSFDYVGAETYQFVRDLVSTNAELFQHLEAALKSTKQRPEARENIVRNAFEAIGMIGGESSERFIEMALTVLRRKDASLRTKYNVVRCLERLHRSAPRPYCDHALGGDWPAEIRASWSWFGACAVRGFHLKKPRPGYFPPMKYALRENNSKNPMQQAVSDCLLKLLKRLLRNRSGGVDAKYLEINISHALIRWLHHKHVPYVKAILENRTLGSESRGNLFQAFLRFRKPAIFSGSTELFRGMTLERCWVTQDCIPDDFHFQDVIIRNRENSVVSVTRDQFDQT